MSKKKIIRVEQVSRIEGESGVTIEIDDKKIQRVSINVFEAPRFFESFLRGRPYQDVVDFTARICGICPVAYQMSSVHAIEKIMGIEVDNEIRELRRLLYCGEWIVSHSLHVYLLHGPDFYNLESAWSDKMYIPYFKRGLNFKNLGNEIITMIGGRSVHPVSVKVGGFYRLPEEKSLKGLIPALERAYEDSLNAVRWAGGFDFGDDESVNEYISLSHPEEYPLNEGRVISSSGLDVDMDGFMKYIEEYQVSHSNALHSGLKTESTTRPYLTGPIARLNLNYKRLPSEILDVMSECGVRLPIRNIKMGIIARSIEIAYSFYETIRIIKNYHKPENLSLERKPIAGQAVWITEAPRGMLIHKYSLDESGNVIDLRLIPPTSQNLSHMEMSLYNFISKNLQKRIDLLKIGCEKLIRSYDPCISCSVHIVRL